MAKLTDLKSLKTKQAKILAGGGWTVDKLATTDITRLVVYPGIDDVTAQRIIGEARQLINLQGYQDAVAADSRPGPQGPGGRQPGEPSEPPKYSVRIQRIMERKARGE